jgi:hypothetical protein
MTKAIRMRGLLAPLAVCWVLAGCSGTPLGVSTGEVFGGEGIRLVVTDAGAELEFDCADGRIEEPLSPGSDGSFEANGTFTFGQGGPIHEDDPPRSEPARYNGVLDGDRLTIGAALLESDMVIGPYALRRGDEGVIRRCL